MWNVTTLECASKQQRFSFLTPRLCSTWSILVFHWANLNLAALMSLCGVIHWHWEVIRLWHRLKIRTGPRTQDSGLWSTYENCEGTGGWVGLGGCGRYRIYVFPLISTTVFLFPAGFPSFFFCFFKNMLLQSHPGCFAFAPPPPSSPQPPWEQQTWEKV